MAEENQIRKEMLTIVCPAFNESGNLAKLLKTLSDELKEVEYSVIIVNDGSSDDTLVKLKSLSKEFSNLKYLSFSRNFGHQNALMAGIKASNSDCVVMMDADMQHPPSLIPEMLRKWKEGFKIVQCIREDKETNLKSLTSKIFYKLLTFISNTKVIPGASDFRLIDRMIVDHLKFQKGSIFLRGYLPWLGYQTYNLAYEPDERHHGESKFTLKKMLQLSLDGIAFQTVVPLRLSRHIGFVVSSLSFIYLLYALFIYTFTNNSIAGWTSVLVSILFLGGIQLICVGILGEYVGRIYEKIQDKPKYIIEETGGFDHEV